MVFFLCKYITEHDDAITWSKISFELLALWEGNPPVISGFPSQMAGNAEVCLKSCSTKVKLPLIWDATKLIWRYSNEDRPINRFRCIANYTLRAVVSGFWLQRGKKYFAYTFLYSGSMHRRPSSWMWHPSRGWERPVHGHALRLGRPMFSEAVDLGSYCTEDDIHGCGGREREGIYRNMPHVWFISLWLIDAYMHHRTGSSLDLVCVCRPKPRPAHHQWHFGKSTIFVSFAKVRPSCPGLTVLTYCIGVYVHFTSYYLSHEYTRHGQWYDKTYPYHHDERKYRET